MQPIDYATIAIDNLRRHPMRAALTMSGIVIGVFAVVITLAVGAGARERITNQIQSLGTNLIVVNTGPPPVAGAPRTVLLRSDAEALSMLLGVGDIAPQQETRLPLAFASRQTVDTGVLGVTPSYARVRRTTLAEGRFVGPDDEASAAKVAVIGITVRRLLAGTDPVIGRRIRIGAVDFVVIGVLAAKGDAIGLGPGMSTDDRVFVPLSALQKRLLGTSEVRLVAISARTAEAIPAASSAIQAVLAQRHPGHRYEVRTELDLLETSGAVGSSVTMLLSLLGAVSLVVGAIGVTNVMLVSVTERTREIGLRRAVGARTRTIAGQFLIEALVLTGMGGLAAILLSWIAALAVTTITGWPVVVSPGAVALALVVSGIAGLGSGLFPAYQAARVDPIDALRSE